MGAKIHFTQERIEEIISTYYANELLIEDIAMKFNISHGLLGNILKKYHVLNKSTGRCFTIHPKFWAEIGEKYLQNKNLSVLALSKLYKVNRSGIERVLKKLDIQIRPTGFYMGAVLSQLDIENLIFDYQNKISLKTLKKKYEIGVERLYQILEENNCPIRPRNELLRTDLSEAEEKYLITEYLERGKSLDLIADEMNFCSSFLKGKLQKLGIEIQPGFARIITRRAASAKGISGHYRGMLFRSFNEISFIVNFLERKNIPYVSGEASRKDGIKYLNTNGKIRNYFPDFLTENFIFEVKPKKFWKQENVLRKSEAARKFAQDNGLKYRIVDYPIIFEPIYDKISKGEIVFTEKGEEKFFRNFGKYLKLS